MIEDIKLSLRVSHNKLDVEIQDLIEAARLDLQQSGVSFEKANDDSDALIKRAITVYCKANFGLGDKDTIRVQEMYQKSYELIKQHLSYSGDYNV